MRIKAYAYEADVHCIACAVKRFGVSPQAAQSIPMTVDLDSNSIPCVAEDNEGNKITPIFSTDECLMTHCGDCHQEL